MPVLSRFGLLRLNWTPWWSAFVSFQAEAQIESTSAPDAVSNMLGPLISHLGFGAVIGFCVGILVKKVSKIVAILVGLAFVLLQVLAFYDVVTIDWVPIKGWWDQATTPDQLQGWWAQVRSILFSNGPVLGGAIPGFALGLKMG